MKKSALILKVFTRAFFYVFGVALFSIVIAGCEDFLEGAEVKNQLESGIEYAALPSYNIEVSLSNSNHGTLYVTGNQNIKLNDSFEIEFRKNNEYKFKGFVVKDKSTGLVIEDAVSIPVENMEVKEQLTNTIYKVSVTLLKPYENLLIQPSCCLINDNIAPVFTGECVFSASEENFNKQKYFSNGFDPLKIIASIWDDEEDEAYDINIASGRFYMNFKILEADSLITKLHIKESYISILGPVSEDDFEIVAPYIQEGDICSFAFDYKLHNTSDPFVTLSIQAEDEGGNLSDIKTISFLNAADISFCVKNTGDSENFTTAQIQEFSKRNADGSIDMSFNVCFKEALYSMLYLNGLLNDTLTWNYYYTQADVIPENNQWHSCDFEFSNYTVYNDISETNFYISNNSFVIKICDTSKPVYVMLKLITSSGISRDFSFIIPPEPAFIETRYTDDGSKSKLYLTFEKPEILAAAADGCNIIDYCYSALVPVNNGWSEISRDNYFVPKLVYENSGNSSSLEYYARVGMFNGINTVWGPLSEKKTISVTDNDVSEYSLSLTDTNVLIEKAPEEKQQVSIILNESQCRNFTGIYVTRAEGYGDSADFIYKFRDNEVSFLYSTQKLFDDGLTLEIFGIDEQKKRCTVIYEIEPGDSRIQDNIKPDVNWHENSLSPFSICYSVTDTMSGLPSEQNVDVTFEKGDGTIKKNITVKLNSASDIFVIPLSCLAGLGLDTNQTSDENMIRVSFSVTDNAGNRNDYSEQIMPKFISGNGNSALRELYTYNYYLVPDNSSQAKLVITTKEKNAYISEYNYCKFKYDFLELSQNTWQPAQTDLGNGNLKLRSYSENGKRQYEFESKTDNTYEYVDTSYSGFIRVFMMKVDNKNKLYSPELYYNYGEYYNAGPFYCWTGGKTTSSNILDIYPGIKTVQIPSDIPFYVHTVWHENDLGTNPDEWEYYVFQSCDHTDGGIDIDESFISEAGCACVNATDFNTPYIYQIPLTEVPSGSYYTTIVHYADGSSVMTDVRRK